MANYSLSVTLGAGDKGKQWDDLVRRHAKKNRMTIGAFVRACIGDRITREQAAAAAPKPAAPAVAADAAQTAQPASA